MKSLKQRRAEKKAEKMRKTWSVAKKVICWYFAALLIILALSFSQSFAGAVFAVAGVLTMPIKKVQETVRRFIPNTGLTILAVVALFFIGVFTAPTESGEDPASSTSMAASSAAAADPSATPDPTATPKPTPVPVSSKLTVHFIDVGQADAALIECDGHFMLIDGGNKDDSSRIYSILKDAGVEKLDIMVASHAHEDHVGGLAGALNYAAADLILCPVTDHDSEAFGDFKKYAEQNGPGITVPAAGAQYQLGDATVTLLGVNGGSDVNNSSIVLKIQHGEVSFLFTGDAERDAEQAILNSGADLSATVLKVGHHGSSDSTTYPFLREIMPQYAVISVGEGNPYGHPTDDTLSRLRDADVKVYRTDMQGDVWCTSDGKEVSFGVERNEGADTLVNPTPTPAPTPEPTPEPTEKPAAQPSGRDYVVNTNTGKFHYPGCSSVKKMKESNKWYYNGTRDYLISSGYSPCGNCHP